nr:hypothetical protein BaRGS_029742 [Batillaria attramentaria]
MGGGGGPGGAELQRYLAQEDMRMFSEERPTPKAPLVMEHPSLRQFVIFMAILFLLALVALIITAVYFGRTASPSWNI